jgi:VanZ family protein
MHRPQVLVLNRVVDMLPLRHPRPWLVIGWIIVALAILFSLLPAQELPKTGINDKWEHFVAYATMALWFAGIYPRSRYVVIALGLFALGVSIEFAQGAMGLGRMRDYHDVIANSIGIVIGMALAFTWLGGWAQHIEALARRS